MAAVVEERASGVGIALRVKPRAPKTRVLGAREGQLDLAVAAPPVDGAANEEIRAFLAKLLAVSRADVEIVTGATGRSKIVEVRGVTVAFVKEKLGLDE